MTMTIEAFPMMLNLKDLPILIICGKDISIKKLETILNKAPQHKWRILANQITDDFEEFVKKKNNVAIITGSCTKEHLMNVSMVVFAGNDPLMFDEVKKIVQFQDVECSDYIEAGFSGIWFASGISTGQHDGLNLIKIQQPAIVLHYEPYICDEIAEEVAPPREKIEENAYSFLSNKQCPARDVRPKASMQAAIMTKERKILGAVGRAGIYSLIVLSLLILGHILFTLIPLEDSYMYVKNIFLKPDSNIWKYVLFGFIAQMIDGALGMAYGVSVTTFLLGAGIPGITPAVASASMHASEIFTTGSSSIFYMKFRNINMKLFKALVWPGIVGAVLGVVVISIVSKEYFVIIKPLVALYTLSLGVIIFLRVFKKPKRKKKIRTLYPIAFAGGFLDSVGGGGWGPIVTSSLLAGDRHLRYTVGSAHMAKFFVALVSTITFFIMIGLSHWTVIVGLVAGGMIAAPLSIYLSNKIPVQKGLISVGLLIIAISIRTLVNSFL
jgi:uncharacterized membrane protein YfcA